jgi:hypothetical protein
LPEVAEDLAEVEEELAPGPEVGQGLLWAVDEQVDRPDGDPEGLGKFVAVEEVRPSADG